MIIKLNNTGSIYDGSLVKVVDRATDYDNSLGVLLDDENCSVFFQMANVTIVEQ